MRWIAEGGPPDLSPALVKGKSLRYQSVADALPMKKQRLQSKLCEKGALVFNRRADPYRAEKLRVKAAASNHLHGGASS